MRGMRAHLARPPRPAAEPVWTSAMTAIALVGIVLSLALVPLADVAAVGLIRRSGDSVWVHAMAQITDLGKSHWYLILAIAAFLAAGLADWSSRTRKGRAWLSFVFGQAAFAFAAVALSGALGNVVKFLVGRARPRLMDDLGSWSLDPFGFDYRFHSFPSGHSTTVGALAVVLMLWFPRASPLILLAAIVLGASRVAAQAHYPSDVIAGLAFGFLCALWLARWLGARAAVFRLVPGRLLPLSRHTRATRAVRA